MRDQLHLKTLYLKLQHKYAWIISGNVRHFHAFTGSFSIRYGVIPYPLYQTLRALLTHTDLLFIFHTLLEYKRTLY